MRGKPHFICSLTLILFLFFSESFYGQISVDAGITPAKDRWIFRTQARMMEREKHGTTNYMKTTMFNNMLAYGIHKNFTVMIMGMYRYSETQMGDIRNSDNGFSDISFISKYAFYRINKSNYTLGSAAVAALNIPIGKENFSSEAWGIKLGLFLSFRTGMNSLDFNISSKYNGITTDRNQNVPGNEASIDFAYTRQIIIGGGSNITFAPLIEISYIIIGSETNEDDMMLENGESILFLSPGVKFTYSSFIAEVLIRAPVLQNQDKRKMKMKIGSILGLRYMF